MAKKRSKKTKVPRKTAESSAMVKVDPSFFPSLAYQVADLAFREIPADEDAPILLDTDTLIQFGRDILVQRAITKIAKAVGKMPWIIKPPPEADLKNPEVAKILKRLIKSFKYPWLGTGKATYQGYTQATVTDLIYFGESFTEKADALNYDDSRFFWLINQPYQNVIPNRDWKAHQAGLDPIYWARDPDKPKSHQFIPFYYAEDGIIFNADCTSFNVEPDSPLKRVVHWLCNWINIGKYRKRTVQTTTKKQIIYIENEKARPQDIDSFKEFWRTKVEKNKEQAIVTGKVGVANLADRNDEELYPGYTEFLIVLIGLGFDLSRRDLNLQEHDNRATAEIASSSTFQDAILPYAMCMEGVYNQQIVEPIAPGYTWVLSDLEPRAEKEEAERADQLFQGGLMTKNEAREAVGLAPVPNGNVFVDGSSPEEKEGGENDKIPLPKPKTDVKTTERELAKTR